MFCMKVLVLVTCMCVQGLNGQGKSGEGSSYPWPRNVR